MELLMKIKISIIIFVLTSIITVAQDFNEEPLLQGEKAERKRMMNDMHNKLKENATAYLEALKENNYLKMVEYLHPAALESMGGKKQFIKVMKQFSKEAAEKQDKTHMLQSIKIEDIGQVREVGDTKISRINVSYPIFWQNTCVARVIAPTFAINRKDERQWYFIEGNKQGRSILIQFDKIPRSTLPPLEIGVIVDEKKIILCRSKKTLKKALVKIAKKFEDSTTEGLFEGEDIEEAFDQTASRFFS